MAQMKSFQILKGKKIDRSVQAVVLNIWDLSNNTNNKKCCILPLLLILIIKEQGRTITMTLLSIDKTMETLKIMQVGSNLMIRKTIKNFSWTMKSTNANTLRKSIGKSSETKKIVMMMTLITMKNLCSWLMI